MQHRRPTAPPLDDAPPAASPPALSIPVTGGFRLPVPLTQVAERIERSRRILQLTENWDGEGSPGYDEATWLRAVGLVVTSSSGHWEVRREPVPAPAISEGPDGSIDVVWRSKGRKLLINVPATPDEAATYYGMDADNARRTVEGRLDPTERNVWLLVWLTE